MFKSKSKLRTHCKQGHLWTNENTMVAWDGSRRRCRTCFNAYYKRKYRENVLSGTLKNCAKDDAKDARGAFGR